MVLMPNAAQIWKLAITTAAHRIPFGIEGHELLAVVMWHLTSSSLKAFSRKKYNNSWTAGSVTHLCCLRLPVALPYCRCLSTSQWKKLIHGYSEGHTLYSMVSSVQPLPLILSNISVVPFSLSSGPGRLPWFGKSLRNHWTLVHQWSKSDIISRIRGWALRLRPNQNLSINTPELTKNSLELCRSWGVRPESCRIGHIQVWTLIDIWSAK